MAVSPRNAGADSPSAGLDAAHDTPLGYGVKSIDPGFSYGQGVCAGGVLGVPSTRARGGARVPWAPGDSRTHRTDRHSTSPSRETDMSEPTSTDNAVARPLTARVPPADGLRRALASVLSDLRAVDGALYAAVAATPTPALDRALRRLSHAADHSKISFAIAGPLALGGARQRRAARACVPGALRGVGGALSAAVAATPTPALDRALRRLSHAAAHSKISFAIAGALALGGARQRRAALAGVGAIAVASASANLLG